MWKFKNTSTSNDGTDISLNDRKKEYINGDNIICQDDCDFTAYNSDLKKAKYECYTKESNSSFADMTINKNKIFEKLKDTKNLINLNILICYKKLLSSNSFIYNIGCLIIICIITFHLISIFIFYIKGLNKIRKITRDILFGKLNISLIKKLKYKTNKKKLSKRKKLKKRNSKIKKSIISEDLKKEKNKIKLNNNFSLDNSKHININTNIEITTNIINNVINDNRSLFKDYKGKSIKKIKKLMNYNTGEMNDLSYNLALKNDKRTFCQYYNSLLKEKHILFFSFYNSDDYNSRIIKIDLFFIGFAIDYTVNALFFNDETMHKIYVKKGLFDWGNQLPIAIYSFFISMIFNYPLSSLGLSNDIIITFKQNLNSNGIIQRGKKLFFYLKLKFIFYYFISFIFLLFFWYYITMFGIIYKNTQYHLLKDTLLSFGLSSFYPFIINLLPGIVRIPSLSNSKKKREYLYNFSKILQLL